MVNDGITNKISSYEHYLFYLRHFFELYLFIRFSGVISRLYISELEKQSFTKVSYAFHN